MDKERKLAQESIVAKELHFLQRMAGYTGDAISKMPHIHRQTVRRGPLFLRLYRREKKNLLRLRSMGMPMTIFIRVECAARLWQNSVIRKHFR